MTQNETLDQIAARKQALLDAELAGETVEKPKHKTVAPRRRTRAEIQTELRHAKAERDASRYPGRFTMRIRALELELQQLSD